MDMNSSSHQDNGLHIGAVVGMKRSFHMALKTTHYSTHISKSIRTWKCEISSISYPNFQQPPPTYIPSPLPQPLSPHCSGEHHHPIEVFVSCIYYHPVSTNPLLFPYLFTYLRSVAGSALAARVAVALAAGAA
ncbi:hypothetical protein K402DRAFT_397697 [Aulographum hederae CBS 113979]|uniref:Uncharacterized protein n=1 Tax=Aulographum hederae CBS 113979 TaxID=1176131 RepID=A0A6G1GNC1_9PEZI|nr:hypothetical protein K402DRAFT_397697 [Aulographum hederae CBS 113979]